MLAFATEQDHPRTRGEKPFTIAAKISKAGSPPHTRGKVTEAFHFVLAVRITPAHAGKRPRITVIVRAI